MRGPSGNSLADRNVSNRMSSQYLQYTVANRIFQIFPWLLTDNVKGTLHSK